MNKTVEWKRWFSSFLLVLIFAMVAGRLHAAEAGITVGDYIFLDGPTSGFRAVSADDFMNGTADGIGIQDATDWPLAGVHVTLYRLTNGLDMSSAELVATTTSDAQGKYEFTGLDAGYYYMAFDAYDAADQLAADGLISSADMLEFTDGDWGDDALDSDVVLQSLCLERDCTQYGQTDVFALTDDMTTLDTIDAGLMLVGNAPDSTETPPLAVAINSANIIPSQLLPQLVTVILITFTVAITAMSVNRSRS